MKNAEFGTVMPGYYMQSFIRLFNFLFMGLDLQGQDKDIGQDCMLCNFTHRLPLDSVSLRDNVCNKLATGDILLLIYIIMSQV